MTIISNGQLEKLTFFRGRVALYAILKAMGIGAGDHVVTQAFTCIAVPEAIIASGAHPVYVDLESNGFNMDPDDFKLKITSQTRAVVVQHTYGIPANMDSIVQIADERSIHIIEDCCHTLVSKYRGKLVGTFGAGSFYSYEWGKPIVVGIGGSAGVNDKDLRKKIERQYSCYNFPLARSQGQYSCYEINILFC